MSDVDWRAIPGPRCYDPDSVERALSSLVESGSSNSDKAAAVRRAVGNDHAGTLYPAAIAAASKLLEIVARNPGSPRQVALSILLDWWGMFRPEPGYEVFFDNDLKLVELIPAIIDSVNNARSIIASIATEDPPSSKAARNLLRCLDAGWTVIDY
jgi:hypothetical protein